MPSRIIPAKGGGEGREGRGGRKGREGEGMGGKRISEDVRAITFDNFVLFTGSFKELNGVFATGSRAPFAHRIVLHKTVHQCFFEVFGQLNIFLFLSRPSPAF